MTEVVDNHMTLDFESLTLDEIDEIETITGMPVDDLAGADKPKGKMLIALCFVIRRRSNLAFTVEDARKLTVGEAEEITAALLVAAPDPIAAAS